MKRFERHAVLFLVCAAAWMMSLLGAARADEFNDERLRVGQDAYASKHYGEAIDQFRIAAFGSLDKAVVLNECLVRLALAQAAAGKTADARATLDRFVEIERHFPGFAQANLQPEVRSAFMTLLLAQIPQATILGVPSLAGLIETEEQKIAKLPPVERRRAFEAAAKREPGNARWMVALASDSLQAGDPKEADRWATKALAIQPDNADALALRARAREARAEYAAAPKATPGRPAPRSAAPSAPTAAAGVVKPTAIAVDLAAQSRAALDESRRLVGSGKSADAERLLNVAVRADPGNRELRLELLEAASLNRSYQTAAAQVAVVKPISDTEAPSLFYAAVALYETGKTDEARSYLERAMPKVSGQLVDEYAKKILGTSGAK